MTHAEQLRKHAELAMREGGMYYSGEYLSRMAKVAESLEAENAKLRELIAGVHESLKADKAGMFHNLTLSAMEDDMRELGIEVDA